MVVLLPGKLSLEDKRLSKLCCVGTIREVSEVCRTGHPTTGLFCSGMCGGAALA